MTAITRVCGWCRTISTIAARVRSSASAGVRALTRQGFCSWAADVSDRTGRLDESGQLAVSQRGSCLYHGPHCDESRRVVHRSYCGGHQVRQRGRTSHSSHTIHTIHASPVITVFDYCYIAAVAQAPYPFPVTFPTSNDPLDDFNTSVQSLWYDTARHLLYAILNLRMNRNTQDFYQFMICSATNGRTWSRAIFIPEITTWQSRLAFFGLQYHEQELDAGLVRCHEFHYGYRISVSGRVFEQRGSRSHSKPGRD